MKQDEVWKNPDESKKEWNASSPYPSWPFGVVDPKELAKWARRIGQLEGVVIIGYDVEGNEYFASSYADRGKILWLLERMKKMLLEMNE